AFDNRLDDQVAVVEGLERRRACDVPQGRVSRSFSHLSLLNTSVEKLADPRQPVLEHAFVDLTNNRTVTGCRANLSNARPHEATSEDADSAYGHAGHSSGRRTSCLSLLHMTKKEPDYVLCA